MIRMRPGQKLVMRDGRIFRINKALYSPGPTPLIWRVRYYDQGKQQGCLAEYRNGWWKEYKKPERRTLTEPSS